MHRVIALFPQGLYLTGVFNSYIKHCSNVILAVFKILIKTPYTLPSISVVLKPCELDTLVHYPSV